MFKDDISVVALCEHGLPFVKCGTCIALTPPSPFTKHDSDKPQYSLIPPYATLTLAQVLTYGAKKYSPDNWWKCKEPNRYYDALLRHLEAWRNGEWNDPDSGYPHLGHAVANAVFLLCLTKAARKDSNHE